MKAFSLVALVSCLLVPVALHAEPATSGIHPTLGYETGPSYILQNDGQYGPTGTKYGAADVGQQDNLVRISRTSLELAVGRHTVILVYAPLEVRTQVELDRDLEFRDQRFAAGTVVDHRYVFDGYRGSYLYRLIDGRFALEVGGSLQIRSADVAFAAADGSQRASESDIGLVAAAKARLWWRPSPTRLWGALEADGFSTFGLLSSVDGAIYDVDLMLGLPVGRGIDLVAGARLLGGGANVKSKDLDNWGNFLSFTVGARVSLDELVRRRPAR